MVVHHGRDGVGIHRKHALEVVGLDVLRAQLEGIGRFLMMSAQVEELADSFAAAGSLVCILLLQSGDTGEQVFLRLGLRCPKLSIFVLKLGDALLLTMLVLLNHLELCAKAHRHSCDRAWKRWRSLSCTHGTRLELFDWTGWILDGCFR